MMCRRHIRRARISTYRLGYPVAETHMSDATPPEMASSGLAVDAFQGFVVD